MKLKTKEILALQSGFGNLDGYLKDGKAELYQLGGVVRLAIARNLNRMKDVADAYRAALNTLISELSEGGNTVPPEKLAAFNKEQIAMLDEEHDVEVTPVSVTDLKLDENPIPASVLALLEPILFS